MRQMGVTLIQRIRLIHLMTKNWTLIVLPSVLRTRVGYTTSPIDSGTVGYCMSNDERSETGRYTERITLENVLTVFETVEGPVVTSGDVAETLECSRETARRKLRSLEEQDQVASRKTAGRVVWWTTGSRAPISGINPEDPFWDFEPGASGESDVSERVDEILYDEGSA